MARTENEGKWEIWNIKMKNRFHGWNVRMKFQQQINLLLQLFFFFLIFNIIPRSVPEDNSKEKIKYNFMKYLFSQIINNFPSFSFGWGNWYQVNCWQEQGGGDESNALGGWGVRSWGSAWMFIWMCYPCRECIFYWGRCSVSLWKLSSSWTHGRAESHSIVRTPR